MIIELVVNLAISRRRAITFRLGDLLVADVLLKHSLGDGQQRVLFHVVRYLQRRAYDGPEHVLVLSKLFH